MSKFLIVIEQSSSGLSAYSPDIPGCAAIGATHEEVERNMRDAIAFHIDGLRDDGAAVPTPRSSAAYVEVAA